MTCICCQSFGIKTDLSPRLCFLTLSHRTSNGFSGFDTWCSARCLFFLPMNDVHSCKRYPRLLDSHIFGPFLTSLPSIWKLNKWRGPSSNWHLHMYLIKTVFSEHKTPQDEDLVSVASASGSPLSCGCGMTYFLWPNLGGTTDASDLWRRQARNFFERSTLTALAP